MNEIYELIQKIKEENIIYGESLQPPASIKDIQNLRLDTQKIFGFKLDTVYMNILEIVNGIDNDGTTLYSAKTNDLIGYDGRFLEGFIEANKIWHYDLYKKSFLIYAESDMYLFFQTKEDSKFHIAPSDSLGTVIYHTNDSVDFFKKILDSCLGVHFE